MSQKTTFIEDVKSLGPHSKLEGDRLNCAVLALSKAFQIPYDKADDFATMSWQRKRMHTTKRSKITQSFTDYKDSMFGKRVREVSPLNEYKTPKKLIKCRSKLYTFAERHKTGTYYVFVRKHCTVIHEGKILDDTLRGMQVEKVYKVE